MTATRIRKWATFVVYFNGRIEDTGMVFKHRTKRGAVGGAIATLGPFYADVVCHRYPDDKARYKRLCRRMGIKE